MGSDIIREPQSIHKSFDLPDNISVSGDIRYYLDLGILKNLGRVKLNGRDLGILWTAPWEVNITGLLKEKGNQLEVIISQSVDQQAHWG